jgi:hypothetical protein
MMEAEGSTSLSQLGMARQFRDGLMVAMLALHPIRLKNFATWKLDPASRKLTVGGGSPCRRLKPRKVVPMNGASMRPLRPAYRAI